MPEKYYIPDLNRFIKKDGVESKALVQANQNNLVDLSTPEKKDWLFNTIKKAEIVEEKEMKQYLGETMPELMKYLEKPVNVDNFRESVNTIFSEVPDEIFEGKSIFEVLKRLVDFIIKRIELDFIIINVNNKRLLYDENYRYPKVYDQYFKTIKIRHSLEEFWRFYVNIQLLLERIYLNALIFRDEKEIGKGELELFRHILNVTGRNLSDFGYRLSTLKQQITQERTFQKRANLPLPAGFEEETNSLIQKIDETNKDIDERIKRTQERKAKVQDILSQKGILNSKAIKAIFEVIKLLK